MLKISIIIVAMKKLKLLALLTLVGVVILWGLAPIVSKILFSSESSFSPGMLVALRGLFSIIAMAIIINKGFKKINKSYLICIPAGIILALAYIFQFVGLKYTVPSKNAFLENISCISIPVFMFIFIKEKPTWYSILSALICVLGSLFLIGEGFNLFSAFKNVDVLGDGLSAVGGLFFGFDIAFTKVFSKDKDPLLYVFLQMCVMTAICFLYTFIFEGAVFKTMAYSFDIKSILIVATLGVFCTALCWAARAWAIKYVDALTVSLLVPLSAVVATSLSIFFNIEEFTINLLIGGLIILASIVISAVFDYRKECKNKIVIDNTFEKEATIDEQHQS